jgi:ribosome-binding factor A
MNKVSNRALRMGEQIHKDIMLILRLKVKDPRIKWVTVNEVSVSKDYSVAKIFYSVMKEEQHKDVALALESAKGFIRSELSKGLTTYTVPQLQFIFDQSLERGMHILQLISKVNQDAVDDDDDNTKLEDNKLSAQEAFSKPIVALNNEELL